MSTSRYRMSISLNVLHHLGLKLYSNRPAVLAEVIANAWDADAHAVRISIDPDGSSVTIADDGCGMNRDDINAKYLVVGYQKRNHETATPNGRAPMGRKGIGKLSLFSIANRVQVYSRRDGHAGEALELDASKIESAIEKEDPSQATPYEPEPLEFDEPNLKHGTIIKISDLKKFPITETAVDGLRKRISRRFGVIGAKNKFQVYINDQEVTLADRDYFHKARFLFQYGDRDYAQYCKNLDVDSYSGDGLCYIRRNEFDASGEFNPSGEFRIGGWIAIAKRSNDLDGKGDDENLNRITIMVRGKVAREDVLQDFRLGGMITKFMFGEICADFLDDDEEEDIATSGRQSISEDDPRYRAFKAFLESELRYIWNKTNKLKDRRGLQIAQQTNPHVQQWYQSLNSEATRALAKKFFGEIEKSGIDDAYKNDLYANTVLAVKHLSHKKTIDELSRVTISDVTQFLDYFSDLSSIEASKYHEIVEGRLEVVRKLNENADQNALEKVLQECIFENLWLLDPAWERATQYAKMEETVKTSIDGVDVKGRVDIRYMRVMVGHVIVELKRPRVQRSKTEIEAQLKKYMLAVRKHLRAAGKPTEPLSAVCIVGKLPLGWQDLEERKKDEESLRPHSIRIITYEELISNAYSAYSKFISASEELRELRDLINKIRSHTG